MDRLRHHHHYRQAIQNLYTCLHLSSLSPIQTSPTIPNHTAVDYEATLCVSSSATFASIFLLAARIISSLLFCRSACLSFLLELHACAPACFCFDISLAAWSSSSRSTACSSANFAFRLYLVIRSGWVGLDG